MKTLAQVGIASVLALVCAVSPLRADAPVPSAGLQIDLPVVLANARVVFNIDHLAFEGETPTGLSYIQHTQDDFIAVGTQYQIVGLFHGAAGYMLLDDARYNAVRHTETGNPYKAMIVALQGRGVQFEMCGLTARNNGWVNADLLPGVKVVTGANPRLIQLDQEAYTQIQP